MGRIRASGIRSRPELRHLFPTRAPPCQPPTSRAGPEGSLHPIVLHLYTETTAGELAHTGQNQPYPLSRHGGTDRAYWASTKIFHQHFGARRARKNARLVTRVRSSSEPNHPQPAEEVTTVGPTLNHFWRMMTDPGFPSPASNPAPFVVTAEAFLGLTNQVQALADMVQTIVPYLPQLIQSTTQQSAPPTVFSQMESPVAPNRETQLEAELP
ncbi:hypothetical protein B296_00006594 [Ensete ventricosum]|uniref:Uncharacterized protein n=1 Tax=Ensete ventricosum TaxID=4639 RepID=A0A426Y8A9_ENSVE|nr:hypothetical protein B296_00006594 [Ensete ventricosum]